MLEIHEKNVFLHNMPLVSYTHELHLNLRPPLNLNLNLNLTANGDK